MINQLNCEIYNIYDEEMSREEMIIFFLQGNRKSIIIQYSEDAIVNHYTYDSVLFQKSYTTEVVKKSEKTIRQALEILNQKKTDMVFVTNSDNQIIDVLIWRDSIVAIKQENISEIADSLEKYEIVYVNELNEIAYEYLEYVKKHHVNNMVVANPDIWDTYKEDTEYSSDIIFKDINDDLSKNENCFEFDIAPIYFWKPSILV